MRKYQFDVRVHYHTDVIYAETEEEAREIANGELDFNGEEYDVTMKCIYKEEVEECEKD